MALWMNLKMPVPFVKYMGCSWACLSTLSNQRTTWTNPEAGAPAARTAGAHALTMLLGRNAAFTDLRVALSYSTFRMKIGKSIGSGTCRTHQPDQPGHEVVER